MAIAGQAATGAAVGPYHGHVTAYDHGDERRHTPRCHGGRDVPMRV
jgi:hypothetical protein